MRVLWLLAAIISIALAALCADGVNLCSDVTQFCCCAGGPPVCTCCALATDACAAGICVPASASSTPTPSLTTGASQTPSMTRSAAPTASPTRTTSASATPSRTPSLTRGVSASSTAAPSPSACAVAGIAVTACNATTALIVGDTVVAVPLRVPPATQIVVDGSLTVAAPVTFAAAAPPVIVLNGTLTLAGDVLVRAGSNATRVVLFVVRSGRVDVAANFTAATDSTCVDAVPDQTTPGEFAVLLVPTAQKSCTGKRASAQSKSLWALTAIGGALCVCAAACVVVLVAAALVAYRFHALRWLFKEREKSDDSVVHSRIERGARRDRA